MEKLYPIGKNDANCGPCVFRKYQEPSPWCRLQARSIKTIDLCDPGPVVRFGDSENELRQLQSMVEGKILNVRNRNEKKI